jgi:hypothetical protein
VVCPRGHRAGREAGREQPRRECHFERFHIRYSVSV